MGPSEGIRLQKVLAAAGLGSRRRCEELIAAGRVEVDGRVVTTQGLRVDPDTALIRIDGEPVPVRPGIVVVMLNKPRGMHTTMTDPSGRPCVGDLVADLPQRVFHVGRLDADTEGLLLLTNDGELGNRLAHPRHGVRKTYLAEVRGPVPRTLVRSLAAGVELDDGSARADSARIVQRGGSSVLIELTLHEGRNRIVRRMFDALGCPVLRLVRTGFGPLKLGSLPPGRVRRLSVPELRAVYGAAELAGPVLR